MKRLLLIIISICTSFVIGQTYCAGDQISLTHQNESQVVCAGTEDYNIGDEFKLADWNGDLNGGNYHVIFIDMGASW